MKFRLFIIVICQFFCTSVWFAGNAVISDIAKELQLSGAFLASMTSAIQFGFITGCLVFAVFGIADRIKPSLVFFFSALLAAFFNLSVSLNGLSANEILVLRFFAGLFLAGIYPVGMKIVADHFDAGVLGRSLGFLVGALVLGTALPHLIKDLSTGLPWRFVIYTSSLLAVTGGLLVLLFIPDGPHRKPAAGFNLLAFTKSFHHRNFSSASFGYFGHMWELYTFWAFLPLILANWNSAHNGDLRISFWSFLVIAFGATACVLSGILSRKYGVKRIASIALFISFCCCLLSPFFLATASPLVLLFFLFIWGFTVIADSPLFSTMVASNAEPSSKGSAMTIVNCIGFAITIFSIEFTAKALRSFDNRYVFMLLSVGPLIGLVALIRNRELN
jgi:MFS family permease